MSPLLPCVRTNVTAQHVANGQCAISACLQAEPKARGATLLRTSLVFAEDTVTKNLQVLLPALCRAAADPDIASVVHDCCAILGCFVGPERVLEIIAPRCGNLFACSDAALLA